MMRRCGLDLVITVPKSRKWPFARKSAVAYKRLAADFLVMTGTPFERSHGNAIARSWAFDPKPDD